MSGVLRIVLIIVATEVALYLVWRLRSVIQLLVISLFFAFALFPVVECRGAQNPSASRRRDPRRLRDAAPPWRPGSS
jgi:hypothetical protein